MRTVNVDGRLGLLVDERVLDVARASQGRFDPDPRAIFPRWAEFPEWSGRFDPSGPAMEHRFVAKPEPATEPEPEPEPDNTPGGSDA